MRGFQCCRNAIWMTNPFLLKIADGNLSTVNFVWKRYRELFDNFRFRLGYTVGQNFTFESRDVVLVLLTDC